MMGVGYYCVLAKKQGLDFRNTVLCTGTHSPTLWIRKPTLKSLDMSMTSALDYIERKSVALADVVWSPSHYLLNWMLRNNPTLPEACFVQQYILPYSARSASVSGSDATHDVKEIVFFGRLETRKGIVVFCDALTVFPENPECGESLYLSWEARGSNGKAQRAVYTRESNEMAVLLANTQRLRSAPGHKLPPAAGRVALMASPVR